MDSLTQIVLGAAVGEATLGKKVGNRALLWGAIGGTIPDLDVIPGQFMDTVSELSIHRGFSHSIFFCLLMAPILGWLVHRIHRKRAASSWDWSRLFFWALFTHPLLDCFTTWGTQLFWPFEWRIALHSVFVIDPLYTLPFLLSVLIVLFLRRGSLWRRKVNRFGLWWSSIYLLLTLVLKTTANSVFESELRKQGISYLRYQSRPAPFSTILWSANVETEDAFLIGYYGFLDDDRNIKFYRFPKNHEALYGFRNHPDLEQLLYLTKGYYTVEAVGANQWEVHDLRFGLSEGWNGAGSFVFTYLINNEGENLQIVQKENDLREAKKMIQSLGQRMKGIK